MVETEHLTLRKFTADDLNDFYLVRSDPEVMKTLPGVKPRTIEETSFIINRDNHRWNEQGFGLWAMIFKEDQKLIGYCGLKYLEETSDVEVIYAVIKPYWGRGLTTEAAAASLKFGFENCRLSEIVAVALPHNLASRRVMEKIGMNFVAQTHNFGVECVRYSITADKFFTNHFQVYQSEPSNN